MNVLAAHKRCALAATVLLVAGCANRTGLLLDVQAGPVKNVATLELVVGHRTYCDRFAQDDSASRTRVSAAPPYTFLVEPVKATDIDDAVVPLVLGYDKSGQLLGVAQFSGTGGLDWKPGTVRKIAAALVSAGDAFSPTGPLYVASDGCVCLPGEPWMGTGSGSGCDLLVHPSAARYSDTTQCKLPSTTLPEPACDGQLYPGETANRTLPCFAAAGTCRLGTRVCADQAGIAYNSECAPPTSATTLAANTLCDQYLACERTACGDVIGCFTKGATVRNCTLRIATPTSTGALAPCQDGQWQATLSTANATGDDCIGSVIEGGTQSLFELGFVAGSANTTSVIGDSCPLALRISKIVPQNIDEVPYSTDVYVTQGDSVVDLHISVVVGCEGAAASTASFSCP